MQDIDKLIEHIRYEQVVLFVGSGFSYSAGAPTASDIVEAIKKDCPEIMRIGLPEVAEEYYQRNGEDRTSLIELVRNLFPEKALNNGLQQKLAKIPHIHTIFTTNYDSYLEDAYGNRAKIIRNDRDIAKENADVELYKLHGDFQSLDSLIIKRSDYDYFFAQNPNPLMWAQLKTAMLNSHILFMGYSIDDSNVYRIITEMETVCTSGLKKMYMVAPTADEYKYQRLKKHNVSWIQSTAEEFLPYLEKQLMDSIFTDYRHKKISSKTFSDFCHNYDVSPQMEEFPESNSVVNIHGYRGTTLKESIKFTISGKNNPMSEWNLEDGNSIMEDGPFKGKQAIEIPSSKLSFLECRVNGLLANSLQDTKTLFVMPLPERFSTKVIIPSRNFIDTLEGTRIRTGSKQMSYIFDFGFCSFKLIVRLKSQDDMGMLFNFTINIELNEYYISQSQALHWVEIIDALGKQEHVLFKNILDCDIVLDDVSDFPYLHLKDYFEMVRDIELKSGVLFSKYHNFTPSLYERAKRLLHWLNKEELYYKDSTEQDITITFDENDELVNMNEKMMKGEWGLMLNRASSKIVFNEHEFVIEYDYVIYDHCHIVSCERESNGNVILKAHNNSLVYREILSSTDLVPDHNHQFIAIDIVK